MKEEKEKETSKLSRREFLKDAGLIVGGATIGSMALMSACGKTETVTTTVAGSSSTKTVTAASTVTKTITEPGSTSTPAASTNVLSLTVNGKAETILIEPNWTLRDALREELEILSIKDMCNGYGACGSCTVIMDGRPILSCMALAVECNGAVIESAEHLADIKHPLTAAYAKNFCAQCGYCTPGFVITAKALLDRNASPSEEEIREALGGNLCRCGTYPQHIIAVNEAAASLKGGN
jgi:aerobic-type carbon monoxide dehydrogenase small subunit (CoxS/CutS family)